MAADETPELEGMPEASLMVRVNGDQQFHDLDSFEAGDEVTLTGVKGVVKRDGTESYKKTGTRPFLQIHITEIGNVKPK